MTYVRKIYTVCVEPGYLLCTVGNLLSQISWPSYCRTMYAILHRNSQRITTTRTTPTTKCKKNTKLFKYSLKRSHFHGPLVLPLDPLPPFLDTMKNFLKIPKQSLLPTFLCLSSGITSKKYNIHNTK